MWPRRASPALVSLALSFALVEIVLRMRLGVEDLYADLLTYPELASTGWARAFVRDYAVLRDRGEVGPPSRR